MSATGKGEVDPAVIRELWEVICDRADHPSEASYTSRLLRDAKGIDKVLEKVGEESNEFVIAGEKRRAAADDRGSGRPPLPPARGTEGSRYRPRRRGRRTKTPAEII